MMLAGFRVSVCNTVLVSCFERLRGDEPLLAFVFESGIDGTSVLRHAQVPR